MQLYTAVLSGFGYFFSLWPEWPEWYVPIEKSWIPASWRHGCENYKLQVTTNDGFHCCKWPNLLVFHSSIPMVEATDSFWHAPIASGFVEVPTVCYQFQQPVADVQLLTEEACCPNSGRSVSVGVELTVISYDDQFCLVNSFFWDFVQKNTALSLWACLVSFWADRNRSNFPIVLFWPHRRMLWFQKPFMTNFP